MLPPYTLVADETKTEEEEEEVTKFGKINAKCEPKNMNKARYLDFGLCIESEKSQQQTSRIGASNPKNKGMILKRFLCKVRIV